MRHPRSRVFTRFYFLKLLEKTVPLSVTSMLNHLFRDIGLILGGRRKEVSGVYGMVLRSPFTQTGATQVLSSFFLPFRHTV